MDIKEIDTKKAIEFCERLKNSLMIGQMDIIITLLKRGKSFEKMYFKIKDTISSHNLIWLEKQMCGLEQKYFNNQQSNKVSKLVKEIDEKVRELLEEI